MALAAFRAAGRQDRVEPYQFPLHPPGVVPSGPGMAMDDIMPMPTAMPTGFVGPMGGVSGIFGSFGFPFLTELAQRSEYRKMANTIATEMVRAWIELQAVGDDKSDKIAKINNEMNRLHVRDCFGDCAEKDGLFGGAHIYIDTGDTENPSELMTSIGDGSSDASKQKIGIGDLKSLRTVEPIWCTPYDYSTSNPLRADWYRPDYWAVSGKAVHSSRFLTMIGRPVPDYLKPAYSFRGLSLSQMAYPYVENWLRTRQSVSDIIHAFSVFVLETDLGAILQGGAGDSLLARLELFNATRDNLGAMAINKETEGFDNVSVPLSGLDALQSQSQEQMSSVSGIPLSILLGITPKGLNASSEGEIRIFYDLIHAYQERLFRQPLTTIINFVQLSLFGEVDPDITFRFVPLWSMSEAERANVRKTEAETAQIHIDSGVITPEEERKRISDDPDTLYPGLNVGDVPDLDEEEAEGLEPKGEEGGAEDALCNLFGAFDADWEETKHPRAENGQFGSGGGKERLSVVGGKPQGGHELKYDKVKKSWGADGVDPQRVKKLAIPPGWSNVRLSHDDDADLQVLATDSKGRPQYRYGEAFSAGKKAAKFERVGRLMEKTADLEAGTLAGVSKGSDTAAAVRLMLLTGMRPGGDEDTGADKKAYGATTLLKGHVKVDGDKVHYAFTGKKGVHIANTVTDNALARHIEGRLAADDGDRLFVTDAVKANALVKALAGGDFKSKDLRTATANRIANRLVAQLPKPTSAKEHASAVNHVGDVVSSQLGNTRAVALADYINPAVFSAWGGPHG